MKKCYRNLIMAMMFLVILFANCVFAATDEEILKSLADTFELTQEVDEESDWYYAYVTYDIETVKKAYPNDNIEIGTEKTGLWVFGSEYPYVSINGTKYYFVTSENQGVKSQNAVANQQLNENQLYINRDNVWEKVLNVDIGFSTDKKGSTSDKENVVVKHTLNISGSNTEKIDSTLDTTDKTVSIPNAGGELRVWFDENYEKYTQGTGTNIYDEGNDNPYEFPFSVDQTGIYKVNGGSSFGDLVGLKLYEIDENGQRKLLDDFEYMTGTNVDETVFSALLESGKQYVIVSENGSMFYLDFTLETTTMEFEDYVEEHKQKSAWDDIDNESLFEKIEALVAKLVMALSKTLNFLLCNALDETITLDDIIFNRYSETKIDFFVYDIDGNYTNTDSSLMPLLRSAINDWYKNFRNIALIGYMILLIYLGIKLLMNSTTPDAKVKMKQTFTTWCMGLIMLMFFPILMKYIILLNNGMVEYISESCEKHSNAQIDPSASEGLLYTDYNNVIQFNGDDYMSVVGKLAEETNKLGFALTYGILSWQLVMMVVYYFKRVFITAFLIIIFPLIALMYVWDKLNDGKAQSLSIWLREFSMCVFVQTFHAIVYVFVVNVIYGTITKSSYDFIILMVASSFLFAGENILKSIFGGGGEALGSASQSARKISLITTVTTKVGSRVIKNVVSKDGYLRRTASAVGQARKYGYLHRKDRQTGRKRFDILATNEAAQIRINKILPTEGQVTPTIREAAEVVDTFNNLDKKTPEEIAKAREEYKRLLKKRQDGSMTPEERKQFDAIMRQSKVSMNQMDRLDKAMANAAVAYSLAGGSEDTKKTIIQNLQVEVEVVLNGADPAKLWTEDEKKIKQYKYKNPPDRVVDRSKISRGTNNMIQASFAGMKRSGVRGIERQDVQDVARQKVQDANRVYNNVKFQTATGAGSANTLPDRATRKQDIADKYKQKLGKANIDTATERQIDIYAEKLAIAQEIGVQEVNVNDAYDVASTVPTSKAAREMFEQMSKLANLQSDIDTLKYALSKKAMTDASVTAGMQQKFAKIAESMEQQARTADTPAYTTEVHIDSGSNNVAVDPYVSILDILQASENNGGNVSDFNDMINVASNPSVIDQIVAEKMDEVRKGNQERRSNAQDFAEEASEYLDKQMKEYEYEQATYMGYTEKEVEQLHKAAIAEAMTNSASMMADAISLPVGALVGTAVGAASTTDGMPFAEMAGGFAGGIETASKLGENVIPSLASGATQRKMQNKFEAKAKERIKDDEKARTKAKTAYEDAVYANRGKADTYLTLDGFTANLIVDANNDLTAIINVRAENAEYISVNEQPGAGAWQSFQENISYTFRDNDYKKSHSLYVYVKDASGNVKNAVQYNLKV